MAFLSPLRYPGGKGDLANFMKLVYLENNLLNAPYIEVYAGGAGIAMALLLNDFTDEIYINDLDRSIFAFWYSVLYETDALCQLINDTDVTIEEWERQQNVQSRAQEPENNVNLLTLGFSTFFLNRTNRSGIIKGGVIGGKNQDGPFKINARYNKDNLINRIRRIAAHQERITLFNMDAADFIQQNLPALPQNALVYLDPPYYLKGQGLYTNFYSHSDHQRIANLVPNITQQWIVSYDHTPEIQNMYRGYREIVYNLAYSAQDRYRGSEVIYFSSGLIIPEVVTPANIDQRNVNRTLFS